MLYATKNKNRGFTLLLSIVVISVMLTIGLSVADIIIKETILSGSGRDSQKAFYIADTGIECAMFWDLTPAVSIFATSSYSAVVPANSGFDCDEEDITVLGGDWIVTDLTGSSGPTPTSAMTSFKIRFDNGTCAGVSVAKDAGTVVIKSSGYSTDCVSSDARKVQRTLEVSY